MFTKKHYRRGPENGKRKIYLNSYSKPDNTPESEKDYIDPFSEPDTEPAEAKPAGNGYMAELDKWLEETVFEPIERAIAQEDSKELHVAFNESKRQIKRRVLESYHNGLKANSASNQKNNGQRTYRRS